MGQQISGTAEGVTSSGPPTSLHASVGDTKIRSEGGDSSRYSSASHWRNNTSGISTPTSVWSETSSGQGDPTKLNRKSDSEINRMSIRAAIDTFIENCLSASNDLSPCGDERNLDGGSTPPSDAIVIVGDSKSSEDHLTVHKSASRKNSKEGYAHANSTAKTLKVGDDEEDNDLEEKELVIDYDNNGPDDGEGKNDSTELKSKSPRNDEKSCQVSTEHKGRSPRNDEKSCQVVKGKCDAEPTLEAKAETGKDVWNEDSSATSNLASDKPSKGSPSGEKQSFSAYLQDRLKNVNCGKCEELVLLASNKDIQSHGPMLMWEMTKKPVPTSEKTGSLTGQGASTFTSGPVRLQTLIDKVLDNSLINQDPRPAISYNKKKKETVNLTQDHDRNVNDTQKWDYSPNDAHPKEKEELVKPLLDAEREAKPEKNTLCFKEHIEKVLLESFLSYEEEERKEALKNTNNANSNITKSAVETDSERMNAKKKITKVGSDGTISVQDIVDQVINQTDVISKLLAPSPSSSDSSKMSSSGSVENASGMSSAQTHPVIKYQNISSHNKALLDAQRHTIQKEHQSSTNMGRKRGRPRLGSPMNSSTNWVVVSGKDRKYSYHEARGRGDLSSSPVPYGHHPSDPARNSHSSAHGHPRAGQGLSPLDYAPHDSIQYGISVGIPSIVNSQGTAPPTSAVFHPRHHVSQQQQTAESPNSAKGSLPMTTSAASGYNQSAHDTFHLRGGQHISSQVQQHPTRGQQHPGQHAGHPPTGKPLPPLILADSGAGSRLVPVSHIPTKSCSCHNCVAHFSREKSPSHTAHLSHQLRSTASKQERPGDATSNSSQYRSYQASSTRRNSKDFYPQDPSGSGAISGQGLPQQPVMSGYSVSQNQRSDPSHAPSSQDASTPRYYDSKGRNPSPGHYSPYQPQAGITKAMLVDPRFLEQDRLASRHTALPECPMFDAAEAARRMTRDKVHHPMTLEAPKVGVSPSHEAPISREPDQPLDLSIKPNPSHREDRRKGFDHVSEGSGQDTIPPECPSASRQSSRETNGRVQGDQGQYVEFEQRGPSGHHLQRLESSVDRFFPQGQAVPSHQTMLHSSHPHLHQQQTAFQQQSGKVNHLPSHQARPDMRGGLPPIQLDRHLPVAQQHQEAPNQLALSNLHPTPSSVNYPHNVPNILLSPLPPQPQYPSLPPGQALRSVALSPSNGQHQTSRSPGLGSGPQIQKTCVSPHLQPYHTSGTLARPGTSASPANYQRPSSHGHEQEARTTPGPALLSASTSPSPQNVPSPEDPNGSRLNISKHEPIQNIIGNHPPSDILYLICRLCRQTYGSPYGFRKHFRNQHGFEPKAEHTIVQTISATKTAMAHTGPLDPADKPLPSLSPKDDKLFYEDCYLQAAAGKSDGDALPATFSAAMPLLEEMKPDKKEIPENTKFLECPECGQTFQLNDFGSYKRHCRQHSLQHSSGPFACHDCQKSFAEPGQLQQHLVTHNTFTPSVCGICRTFFSSPTYLAGHLQAAHGHVYSSEAEDKSLVYSDGSSKQTEIELSQHKSEVVSKDLPMDKELGLLPNSSGAAPLLSSGQNAQPTSASESISSKSSPLSSASVSPPSHTLPLSKRHRINLLSADSQLFTVHTPKGLEVQKLPADAVVTTASPDSSYDEAKYHLNSEPGNGHSLTAGENDTANKDLTSDSTLVGRGCKTSSAMPSLPKQSDVSTRGGSGSKDDTESNFSDRSASTESNSMSNSTGIGSRAVSPMLDDADLFYEHKKYSRFRKRVGSFDVGSDPADSKMQRLDLSQRQDHSPYSVSSTVNSGVTVRDCESSCLHSDDSKDSTTGSNRSKVENGKWEEKITNKHGSSRKEDSAENSSELGNRKSEFGDASKKSSAGDGSLKFKWDRQTRSQAGKASQSISYTT